LTLQYSLASVHGKILTTSINFSNAQSVKDPGGWDFADGLNVALFISKIWFYGNLLKNW
jgi:hypothetical protein